MVQEHVGTLAAQDGARILSQSQKPIAQRNTHVVSSFHWESSNVDDDGLCTCCLGQASSRVCRVKKEEASGKSLQREASGKGLQREASGKGLQREASEKGLQREASGKSLQREAAG